MLLRLFLEAERMNAMNVHTFERAIHITDHSMQRLNERVVNHDGFKSWKQLVKKARYYGRTDLDMDDTEIQWCREKMHGLTSSAQIRIMNGFAFLFMGDNGHARTLVTVIKVA